MKVLLQQILKFGLVGGTATLIDYGLMILFTEAFHMDYLLSSAISFSISVVFNYIFSVLWVFNVEKQTNHHGKNFAIFLILSIIGLGLNLFFMWLGSDILGIHYAITKIFATLIVMIFNFITRKIFLEKHAFSSKNL